MNLVDLERCLRMRTKYLDAKIGVDTAENAENAYLNAKIGVDP